MEENKPTFEEKMNRLEEIVNKINEGKLTLENSLALYDEGKKLISDLTEELKKAEGKIIEVNK